MKPKFECKIVTAYAYVPSMGGYVVGAYVHEAPNLGLPNVYAFKVLGTYTTADTLQDGETEVISRIYRGNVRHPPNMDVVRRGRVALDRLTRYGF